MKTVLITGGTGLIGQELTQLLIEVGYQVIIMGRQRPQSVSPDSKIKYAQWDVKNQTLDVAALQEADYIVHLAGANVAAQRWTAAICHQLPPCVHSATLLSPVHCPFRPQCLCQQLLPTVSVPVAVRTPTETSSLVV